MAKSKIHNRITEIADIWEKNINKKIKQQRAKNRKRNSHG